VTPRAVALFATFTDYQTQGNIAPYAALFAAGFVIATVGHLARAREVIVVGLVIAGLATVLPWFVWGNGA